MRKMTIYQDAFLEQFEITIEQLTLEQVRDLYGERDQNLQLIAQFFSCEIHARSNVIKVTKTTSQQQAQITQVIADISDLIREGREVTARDIVYACNLAKEEGGAGEMASLYQHPIAKNYEGKMVYPKTISQRHYVNALKTHDIVFGVGPAGTGKTYLAVVYAVALWKKNLIKRIVLTRPAVEAGESLGFLPGDLKEKVDPYLRPLYDALYDMLGEENTNKMMEKGIIEVAPLAYMRGRTLEDAYIILDEAQNTTEAQMKMFLTRMGFKSKMVITGDVTQIDLPGGKRSGLVHACKLLGDVSGIHIAYLTSKDVVRHPLVQKIIERYEGMTPERKLPAKEDGKEASIDEQ